MVIIIFLLLAILCKGNFLYKEYIYNNIYKTNISFSYFKNIYNKYLGGVLPKYNINNVESVFDEKISYSDSSSYENGVKLLVNSNYLVPVLKDGIVVYVGEKEKYGNVIMVEDKNGIDIWYGNICNSSVKLYDNLKTGSYVGEACNDYIYLVYSKGENYLDYNDYLK